MFDSEVVQATITPIVALVGAVTGILSLLLAVNNWRMNRKSHHTSIRVQCSYSHRKRDSHGQAHPVDRPGDHVAIEFRLANDSYFAVTVVEYGFVLKNSRIQRTYAIVSNLTGKRIEARDVNTVAFSLSKEHIRGTHDFFADRRSLSELDRVVNLYVRLSSGATFLGSKKEATGLAGACRDFVSAHKGLLFPVPGDASGHSN